MSENAAGRADAATRGDAAGVSRPKAGRRGPATGGRQRGDTPKDVLTGEAAALVDELRAVDRKNAEELRALRLPIEREPVFVFRAARPGTR